MYIIIIITIMIIIMIIIGAQYRQPMAARLGADYV